MFLWTRNGTQTQAVTGLKPKAHWVLSLVLMCSNFNSCRESKVLKCFIRGRNQSQNYYTVHWLECLSICERLKKGKSYSLPEAMGFSWLRHNLMARNWMKPLLSQWLNAYVWQLQYHHETEGLNVIIRPNYGFLNP